jgi:hypothetical protein
MSNNTTIPINPDETPSDYIIGAGTTEKWIGLSLALSSSFLIGTSFILTKKGLIETSKSNELLL